MKPWLGEEESQAAAEAVASGWVAQGPRVAEFEEAIRSHVGTEGAVALSSCTTALHVGLVLLGVGPGDDVIVPSLSFIATANAVRYCGANPVFADVDPETQNVTAKTVESVMTPATRAVIVVDQGGMPADLVSLEQLCDPLGVEILEDAACALGSTYHDEPVGRHAAMAAFSFHPRKVITTGEGGMLLVNRADWTDRARRLREHGMSVSAAARHASKSVVLEDYVELGFNYRMTDIQAAVGLVQLGRLADMVARRRSLASAYHQMLADVDGLQMHRDPPYGETNYQSFWVALPDDLPRERNDVLTDLMAAGVSARRGIMASHREQAYQGVQHAPLPVTEHLTDRTLILPMFHTMTEAEQEQVVTALKRVIAGG